MYAEVQLKISTYISDMNNKLINCDSVKQQVGLLICCSCIILTMNISMFQFYYIYYCWKVLQSGIICGLETITDYLFRNVSIDVLTIVFPYKFDFAACFEQVCLCSEKRDFTSLFCSLFNILYQWLFSHVIKFVDLKISGLRGHINM